MNKNDYLGEYTGELISHREADKRGKIYDRANSSFLFDLNDQASNIYYSGHVHTHHATTFLCFAMLLPESNVFYRIYTFLRTVLNFRYCIFLTVCPRCLSKRRQAKICKPFIKS